LEIKWSGHLSSPKKPKVAKFDLAHSENYVIAPENTLVFMTTPEGREELAGLLKE